MKPPILCIVGPTAVGKTDFFLQLVKDGFPFAAIVADSRQVYKYMDIGTGKDLPTNPQLRQKFWLIDSVTPDQPFSSANFYALAHQAIGRILSSNQLPVIIGGTGRYIKDLQSPPATLMVPPNHKLRQQLQSLSVTQLQQKLNHINPSKLDSMNNSDRHNPRRLIRAIEVSQNIPNTHASSNYIFHTICLSAPLQLIKVKIKLRVDKRLQQGMIDEVKQLLARYPHFHQYQSLHTPGYQEITDYLHGKISLDAAKNLWISREIDYAKRQLTWFRHQLQAVWFDITSPSWYAEAIKQLQKWHYVPSHP